MFGLKLIKEITYDNLMYQIIDGKNETASVRENLKTVSKQLDEANDTKASLQLQLEKITAEKKALEVQVRKLQVKVNDTAEVKAEKVKAVKEKKAEEVVEKPKTTRKKKAE